MTMATEESDSNGEVLSPISNNNLSSPVASNNKVGLRKQWTDWLLDISGSITQSKELKIVITQFIIFVFFASIDYATIWILKLYFSEDIKKSVFVADIFDWILSPGSLIAITTRYISSIIVEIKKTQDRTVEQLKEKEE